MAKPLKSGRCLYGFALQSMSEAYRRDNDLVNPIRHQLLYALLRPALDRRASSRSSWWLPAQEARLLSGVASTRTVALYISFTPFTRSFNLPTNILRLFFRGKDRVTRNLRAV